MQFFLFSLCFLLGSMRSKAQITLNYAEFEVFVKPKKSNDTIE